MQAGTWSQGELIVRREVRNDGWAWFELPVVVVEDSAELLATYIPEGAPFTFPPGPEPHPWAGRSAWEGHGALMLQRPDDLHAVWVFWHGPEREFGGWYLNIQEPFRRASHGYDTQDLELDIVVDAAGGWRWKDAELVEQRVAEGRYTREQACAAWAEGRRLAADLDAGYRWWDPYWALWEPDPRWARLA